MDFLRRLFGKKQSAGESSSYVPYRQSNVDIVGVWIHQESTNTFYHHFYYVDKELRFDTFQVVYPNKLGVTLRASDINWDGNSLKATQVSRTGFKVHTQLRIRGDLLEGTVRANNGNPDQMAMRKLPDEIVEKEIENLKKMGVAFGNTDK